MSRLRFYCCMKPSGYRPRLIFLSLPRLIFSRLPRLIFSSLQCLIFSSLPQQRISTVHKQKIAEASTSSLTLIMCFLVFVSICFLIDAMTVDAQQCYFPDGSKSPDTLCRPQSSGQASVCCGNADVCLDNSLCLAQRGYGAISRGSCTDPTWQSDGCPQYCQDGKFQIIYGFRVSSLSFFL